MKTLQKLICILALLGCAAIARVPMEAQSVVGQGATALQQTGGMPWQFGGDWKFNSSSTATPGFDVRGISYYRVLWVPVGTVSTCGLSIDSAAAVDPVLGTLTSPVIGGILSAATLGSCATAGTYVSAAAAGVSAYGQITPTITGSGSVIVVVFGYTENPASSGSGSVSSGTTGQPAVYIGTTSVGSKPWPNGTDITVGAVCDGATDDHVVLQANLTASANGTAMVPDGKGTCATTVSLTLPLNTSLYLGHGSTIKATAAIATAAVLQTVVGTTSNPEFLGGGTIDANGNADYGLYIRTFHQVQIHNLNILNAQVYGLRLGNTADGAYSYGASVFDMVIDRPTGATPAGSIGIWLDNAGDSWIGPNNEIMSYERGIVVGNTGGSVFANNHVWHHATQEVAAFEDGGRSNIWANDYADDPSTYGFHFTSTSNRSIVNGGNVFVNAASGTDNTLIGLQFDQAAPTATVEGVSFTGGDVTHRIATDIVATNGLTNIQTSGNQTSNVVNINSGPHSTSITGSQGNQLTLNGAAGEFAADQLKISSNDSGAGGNNVNFDPTTPTAAGATGFRFCRTLNNTGGCQLQVFKADNTATLAWAMSPSGKMTSYFLQPTSGIGVTPVEAAPAAITLGSATSISATSLCSTVFCPAGVYDVQAFVEVTTACTTTGTYIVWLGWTDDAGANTGSSTTTFIPLNGFGVTQSTGALDLSLTTHYGQGHHVIRTTGAATGGLGSINYGTTATACGTGGPMVGTMYLTVTRME